jgi:hypothetical protein
MLIHSWRATARAGATVALAVAVAGCGGGGGGNDGGSELSNAVAVSAAMRNLLTTGGSWVVEGIGSDAQRYRITFGSTPAAPTIFPATGELLARATQSVEIVRNGVPFSASVGDAYFHAGGGLPVGFVDADGICHFAVQRLDPPAIAFAGERDRMLGIRELVQCSDRGFWQGYLTVDWAVLREGGLTYYCEDTTVLNASQTVVLGLQSICVEAAQDGRLGARARVSIDVPSVFSIVATN